MNAYGYDYYIPNDNLYFDESSYIETIKPLDKIENFENDIDSLLNDNKDESMLQKLCEKKNAFCNLLQQKYKECMSSLQRKNYELNYYHNHVFLLYILLIFSIIFIFYQRMSINSLNQLIYILKWNINNPTNLNNK
jgi:hypothetical protein